MLSHEDKGARHATPPRRALQNARALVHAFEQTGGLVDAPARILLKIRDAPRTRLASRHRVPAREEGVFFVCVCSTLADIDDLGAFRHRGHDGRRVW